MSPCESGIKQFVDIKKDVLDILFDSEAKLTSQAYIKEIKKHLKISSRNARKILQQLINEQELCYISLYGSTYVEKSFLKPVRISKHFILKPLGITARSESDKDIEIIIEQGISFGSGQHPTTQLCLEAIDHCLLENRYIDSATGENAADIGTGSGVLALALCKAGICSCKAYEIDPVSVNEAKKNIFHNKLENNIQVIDQYMEEEKDRYSLICANLRFPTLVNLSDLIRSSLKENGLAVLSGVREWEKEKLISTFSKKGFDLSWQKDRKKWSAFVLHKNLC